MGSPSLLARATSDLKYFLLDSIEEGEIDQDDFEDEK